MARNICYANIKIPRLGHFPCLGMILEGTDCHPIAANATLKHEIYVPAQTSPMQRFERNYMTMTIVGNSPQRFYPTAISFNGEGCFQQQLK